MAGRELPAARHVWRRLCLLAVFVMAMGLLEANCVIYLRRLLPVAGWAAAAHTPALERLHLEIIREACTLLMLVVVAWRGGINGRLRCACFFYAFGLWDILYYAGLKWLAHWPASWLEWDCLFLIPKPWHGPVLAPVMLNDYFAGAFSSRCACCIAFDTASRMARISRRLALFVAPPTVKVLWKTTGPPEPPIRPDAWFKSG